MASSVISRGSLRLLTRQSPALSLRPLSTFEHLKVETPSEFVTHVKLNRPEKRNAINMKMWAEIGTVFDELSVDQDCRAIVISGEGKGFTAGIDLMSFMGQSQKVDQDADIARKVGQMMKIIAPMQEQFSALERCAKPVIAAIDGACIGGGIDLITAADIRICSKDSWFSVREVNIGLAADVGTLQRLPKVIGNQSFVRDICLTARDFYAEEARREGLVSQVFEDKAAVLEGALSMAKEIASKSPVAVQGTKYYLVYARDHSVQEGLESMRRWNGTMLQSEDVVKAAMAALSKEGTPTFEKL